MPVPAVAGLGRMLTGAIAGGVVSKMGNVDKTVAAVRIGRFLYVSSATYIGTAWYVGWRNERVEPGSGKFPLPGSKLPVIRPGGAPDAEHMADATNPEWRGAAGYGDVAGPPTPTPNMPAPGHGGAQALLLQIAETGRTAFDLRISEHPKYGGVHAGHSPNSGHKVGRAFDGTGTPAKMAAFAHWVARAHGGQLTELYWRGPNWVNIKNGRPVGRDFPGAMFGSDQHTRHVHVMV